MSERVEQKQAPPTNEGATVALSGEAAEVAMALAARWGTTVTGALERIALEWRERERQREEAANRARAKSAEVVRLHQPTREGEPRE